MLPSASALASRREERVQKAFSVDHHGPGDARLSQSAAGIYGESGDYVRLMASSRATICLVLLFAGPANAGRHAAPSRPLPNATDAAFLHAPHLLR